LLVPNLRSVFMVSSSSVVLIRRTLCAVMAVTGCVQIISSAHPAGATCADPSREGEAMSHLTLGNETYERNAFDESLREYRAAYDLCRSPMMFFSMASSELSLGDESDAACHFDKFLRDAPDAESELRQDAQDKLRSLSGRLMLVDLAGALNGVTVFVDERAANDWVPVGPLCLSPGRHVFRIEGQAGKTLERVLTGAAGSRLRVDVPASFTEAAIIPSRPPFWRRWWFWGGLAGVIVAGATTGYLISRPDRPPCPGFCP
jgi:hypothetical protein